MSNRYSALNRRPGAATSSLFADYPGSRPSSNPPQTRQPYNNLDPNTNTTTNRTPSPYYTQPSDHSSPLFNSYPSTTKPTSKPTNTSSYTSTALLDHLESQNETTQTSLLSSKVSQLKQLSLAIGDEIRDSSTLAQTINDSFENTSHRLKGTMKRMLRMAERTGVGWRVWVGFFVALWLVFGYVWLF